MEITNNELMAAQQALERLGKLPLETGWALAETSCKIEDALRTLANMRDTLVRQYQVELAPMEGGELKITSKVAGNAQKFGAAFNEALAKTIELDIVKVKLPRKFNVEPSVLAGLRKFVER